MSVLQITSKRGVTGALIALFYLLQNISNITLFYKNKFYKNKKTENNETMRTYSEQTEAEMLCYQGHFSLNVLIYYRNTKPSAVQKIC